MRIKKSAILTSDSKKSPNTLKNNAKNIDLDPTTNDKLANSIWRRLIDGIHSMSDQDISGKLKGKIHQNDGKILRNELSMQRRFGQDMRRLVKVVLQAYLNPVHLPWDIADFYEECILKGRDKRRIRYPNPNFGAKSQPMTLVDIRGRIVLWYLPGLLSSRQMSDVRQATVTIGPLLKKSVETDKPNKRPNWRIHMKNFVRKTRTHFCEPGSVTFSAGWLGQGHTTDEYDLLPSLNLRTRGYLGSSKWLDESNGLERFVNLTLSLINPGFFDMGLSILRELRELDGTKDIAKSWQSINTGISIVSNRLSPAHRDSKGRPEWYDTLVNYAADGAYPRLLLKDVGLDLDYSSGTLVSFCGTILNHEVRSWGDGDRVCYAHFMRESVRKRLNVPPAGWVYREIYTIEECDGDGDFIMLD